MILSFPIPDSALAQHIAILGKTGSGKTTAAKGAVELILDCVDDVARPCVIDPTGAWWGMKSSATGKSAGYPFVIFGGDHADFPLAAAHGEAIAEIVGTTNTPAIIDTSQMRIGERTKFFTEFADGIMRKNRGPLHLIIDEAHMFMPQGKVPDPSSGMMLAAGNHLVSGGRSRGLRIMLITQRPAKLHKDALTQVETLVAMRLIAPQDRKAVEEWIKDNADPDKGREIIASLATLKTGQGWVWAPEIGMLERVQFPRIKTFDSSAAPTGSGDGKGPVLASINRDSISDRLKQHAEQVAANDPAELKRQIRELQKQFAAKVPDIDESAIADARDEGYIRGRAAGFEQALEVFESSQSSLRRQIAEAKQRIDARPENPVRRVIEGRRPDESSKLRAGTAPSLPRARQIDGRASSDADVGTGGKRRMLTALAQYREGMTSRKLSILVDIAPSGGTWRTYMTEMRSRGWIESPQRDFHRITDAGLKALGPFEELPTGEALIEYWRNRLGDSGKRKIFDAIVRVYPRAISVDRVSEQTGIAKEGGTWRTYLTELRGLGIIEGRHELKASEDLF